MVAEKGRTSFSSPLLRKRPNRSVALFYPRLYDPAPMKVLGIETSCDETGIALYDSEAGILADALYSQIKLHQQYGGVVPELASRDHIRKTLPLIREVLTRANCSGKDLDGIAYTAGPGLAGALLVGASIGRSLGMALP